MNSEPQKPWDIPPFPKRGNASQNVLFESIGRALMAWEEIEGSLAHLYSAFSTDNQFNELSNREYGKPDNFWERLSVLDKAAKKYFIVHHDQKIEGEFSKLTEYAIGYAARRNEIAHGRARPIQWIYEPTKSLLSIAPFQWCIIPPHFRGKKFTKQNVPVFVYTSREINRFSEAFWDVARLANDLGRKIDRPPPLPEIPTLLDG
jgi:hypothetical protein